MDRKALMMKINGGLASQLSKYCFGYRLAEVKNKELILDINDYLEGYFRPFVMDKITLPNVRLVNTYKNLKKHSNPIHINNERIITKEFKQNKERDIYIEGEQFGTYYNFIKKYETILGTQSYKKILQDVSYVEKAAFIERFKGIISDKKSVMVHIRLGDFVKIGWQSEWERYRAAIGMVLKRYPMSHIYIFSNDISECEAKIGYNERITYIKHGQGYELDVIEFLCMSMCEIKVASCKSSYADYAYNIGLHQFGYNIKYEIESLSPDDVNEGIEFYNHNVNKDCVSYNELVIEDLWPPYAYYKLKTISHKKVVIVTSDEQPQDNYYIYSGLMQVAYNLALNGMDVCLIPISFQNNKRKTELINATDRDGIELGYKMVDGFSAHDDLDVIIRDLIGKDSNENIIILSDVGIKTAYKYIRCKFSYLSARRSTKKVLRNARIITRMKSISKPYKVVDINLKYSDFNNAEICLSNVDMGKLLNEPYKKVYSCIIDE